MIKRLLFLFGLIFAALMVPKAHAGTCTTLSSGASQSTIASAISSCGSGNTVIFGAGSYTVSSTITIPCGVSLSGPAITYSQTPHQTATINGSVGNFNWGFQTTASCSVPQTIQYLEYNGHQPTYGGGMLYVQPNTQNLTIQYNWMHGVDDPAASGNSYGYSIFFGNGSDSSTDSNISIIWNYFGQTTAYDCPSSWTNNTGAENDNGALCGGIGIQNGVTNLDVEYNIFNYLEEPVKGFETQCNLTGGTPPCVPTVARAYNWNNAVFNHNSYMNYARIGNETQIFNPGTGTLIYNNYNNWGPRNNVQQDYDLSAANGCVTNMGTPASTSGYAAGPGQCETHSDYNVVVQPNSSSPYGSAADVGFEIWGQGPSGCTTHCTTAQYNLFQGYLGNAITWAPAGNYQFNNNTFNMYYYGSGWNNTSCATNSSGSGFFHIEDNPAFPCTNNVGNTYSNAVTGTYTSAAPSLSFSSPTVTIFNTGQNRDVNTTDWCTTDGSTPTPGGGSSKGYTNGGAITISGTNITVKCVGMWGSLNQPYSYPTNFGYVPSSVVQGTFSTCTNCAVTPSFNPTSESFSGTLSVAASTSTPGSTIYCTTNGTTPTTSSPVYSAPFSISATTTIQCIAAAPGFSNSGVGSSTYTLLPPPTLTYCYQGNSGSVNTLTVGQYVQQNAFCYYSSGAITTNCTTADQYGNGVTAWGAISGAAISVGAAGAGSGCSSSLQGAGCIKGVSAGTASSTASVTGGVSCNPWGWTVSGGAPTLNSAAMVVQTGGTSVTVGRTVTMCVNLGYITPTVSTQVCGNGTDTYGTVVSGFASSSPSNATIVASTGVLTGVSAGSTTVSASVNSGEYTPSLAVSVAAPSVTPQQQLLGPTNILGSVTIP